VEVRESSNVAAQPPCKFPLVLHSSGAAVKDQEVDCDSAEAETKVVYWRGRASKQTLSPAGGGAVNALWRARTRSVAERERLGCW
jgi:hypothetical protein